MILGDKKIKKAIDKGTIVIEPYDESCVGQNSYDVHLGKTLAVYTDHILDAKKPPAVNYFDIPQDGFVLHPGELYLGATKEYTESYKYVPNVDGKSSVGRLGIFIHVTAGRGDVGFKNHFTLEITVIKPVRVYAGMAIGQLTFMETTGVKNTYDKKKTAKYNGRDPRPMPSRMWMNFPQETPDEAKIIQIPSQGRGPKKIR